MKNWKENRILASVVLAAVVLCSVIGIGGMKVNRISAKAQQAYAEQIAADLALRTAAAENLAAASEQALGADAASVVSAKKALEEMRGAQGPADAAKANAAMTASVGMMYEEARKVLGDDKGSVLQTQWSEFLSRGNIIDRAAKEYNETARAAQKKLSGFPASLLCAMTGAHAEEFTA